MQPSLHAKDRPFSPPLKNVKKTSLFSRIKSIPFDLYLSLGEKLSTDDYQEFSLSASRQYLTSWPIGLFLLLGYAFIKWAYRGQLGEHAAARALTFEDFLSNAVFFYYLQWVFVFYAYGNAFWTLVCWKKYQIRHADPNAPLTSPNMKRVKATAATADSEEPVYQLSVWQPSTFGLDVLSFFGPLHVLILHVYPVTLGTLAVLGCLTFQCLLLVNLYGQAVRDRQLLHGQLLREYDTRFVYPTIAKMKSLEATLKSKQMQELAALSDMLGHSHAAHSPSTPYSPSSAEFARAAAASPLSIYQKKGGPERASKENKSAEAGNSRVSPRRGVRK